MSFLIEGIKMFTFELKMVKGDFIDLIYQLIVENITTNKAWR